ncbi:hypothetical protein [Variovorax sp. RO1]|uniref:hypothetical protein n=1 Tax=Variovorax sp. RO1 TaxID=2066034 RepID=UPI00117CB0B9|nr:hypothetical protein [Variovorax sp. RO1]
MRISKSIILIAIYFLTPFSFAGRLLQFEYPSLLIFKSQAGVYGYYRSTLPEVSGIRKSPIECRFFFYSKGRPAIESGKYFADVFLTEGAFSKRNKSSDTFASIYHQDSTWFIQVQQQDASCDGAAGWDFRLGPNDRDVTRFDVTVNTGAMYLRLALKKEKILPHWKSISSQAIKNLNPGDVVAVTKEEFMFSKVRWLSPETGEIIEGWVRTETLVNPFPD